MALFRCKMCGGSLEINSGETVATCEYCGTQQTLPKLDDDRRVNLYDRANHFRRNNEFDKAMGIYEQILNEDTTDAEAYWSIVLCRYGIEYVEDPSSHRRVPTVNRAQFTSVFDDDNYKSALQYADSYQRNVYEKEAKEINEIQKGILAISQKEEPFDVFICYKESDNSGRRTPDSVLANDLYHQLIQEGFKVFFSRITLEDKLGQEYEPYIFAALNSAKVMVVLGTQPEYFKAVWVRNEWSRYLSLIKQGQQKILIPAYKDMDPYDLPEEFSHLQAQDMSKLGFMQDLIRGIKKLTQVDEPKPTVIKETVVSTGNANTAPLLERVFMFLEDGDWSSADEYCEKVLDIDPKNAKAYLGKLMAELRVRTQERLKDQSDVFNGRNNFQKAMRFADDNLKKELQSYIDFIVNRNLTTAYNDAVRAMESASSEADYKRAAQKFDKISDFKDSKELSIKCLELAEEARLKALYANAKKLMESAVTEAGYIGAATHFEEISDYEDSALLAKKCYEKAETAKIEHERNSIYAQALRLMDSDDTASIEKAIKKFGFIPGWKDADEKILVCEEKIAELKAARLEREAKEEADRIALKKQERKKTIIGFAVAIIAIIAVIIGIRASNNAKYTEAIELWNSGSKQKAVVIFQGIYSFKDASSYVDDFKGNILSQLYNRQWTTELISDSNGDTTWTGHYYLVFQNDTQAVLSWSGRYKGGRTAASTGDSVETYSFVIRDGQIILNVDSHTGEIVMEGDHVKHLTLGIRVYTSGKVYKFTN